MRSRVVSLLLAEGVAIDQLTSRLTVFNDMDVIFTQAIPAQLHRLAVVVIHQTAETSEEFFERVVIRSPDDAVAHLSEMPLRLKPRAQAPSHRSVHMFWQLVLRQLGEFRVCVERRDGEDGAWEEVASRRFVVSDAKHPLFPTRV